MKHEDINLSDTQALIKEWRALLTAGRDVEFAKTQYARKVRKRIRPGDGGDRDFKTWCCVNLKETDAGAEFVFSLSIAGGVFKNAVEYSAAGGEKAIDKIWGTVSAAEQEAIMRTAKEQALAIQTVLSRRTKTQSKPIRTPVQDARALAKYLARNADKLPANVREIVARYVSLDAAVTP